LRREKEIECEFGGEEDVRCEESTCEGCVIFREEIILGAYFGRKRIEKR
jgi:hypothetical protein